MPNWLHNHFQSKLDREVVYHLHWLTCWRIYFLLTNEWSSLGDSLWKNLEYFTLILVTATQELACIADFIFSSGIRYLNLRQNVATEWHCHWFRLSQSLLFKLIQSFPWFKDATVEIQTSFFSVEIYSCFEIYCHLNSHVLK